MRNARLCCWAPWTVSLGLLPPQQNPPEQVDVFAIRTALVSVTDEKGTLVPGLELEEFSVAEKGIPRDVVEVAWAEGDTEVYLLVDTSVVFRGEVPPMRRAVQAFFEPVRIGDQVTLYEYGQRPRRRVGPTGERQALQRSAARLNAWPEGAYLLDAIEEVSEGILAAGREQNQHPAVVVILGGAGPDLSNTNYQRAIDIGTRCGAVFHTVIFDQAPVAGDALRRSQVDQALYALAKNSRGTVRRVLTAQALEPEISGLAQEIFQSGYNVSFLTEVDVPTMAAELAVTVARPDLKAEVLTVLPWERRVKVSTP